MSKNTAPSTPEEISDALAQFEAEKMTRRRALKKFGITTGMAVFGMFAADDLARMVIKKMEEHQETRQIAEIVAGELENTGIAFADPMPCQNGGSVLPGCKGADIGYNCACCPSGYSKPADCAAAACKRCYPDGVNSSLLNALMHLDQVKAYNQCLADAKNYNNTFSGC